MYAVCSGVGDGGVLYGYVGVGSVDVYSLVFGLVDGGVLYGYVGVGSFEGYGSLDSVSGECLCGCIVEGCVGDGDVVSTVDPDGVSGVVVD